MVPVRKGEQAEGGDPALMRSKFLTIVGARPQFIKASPLSRELRRQHQEVLVHTGQHYDYGMSAVFFEELGLPAPDYELGIGSGPHGAQTGAMLAAIETVLMMERPDAVVVYGDTNSTVAGALAAAKLHIPVAHIEAGLRSFNRAMPEELNRVLTDHLATWHFAPSEVAQRQLEDEGIVAGVSVVGDIMYDAVLLHRERAAKCSPFPANVGLAPKAYYLATIHRAENTDNAASLARIVAGLNRLDRPVLLPLHPRTRKRLQEFGIEPGGNVRLIESVGYLDMLQLERSAACILTDSGGVQKEAYYLAVPCVTLRTETEWVETVAVGWNRLCTADPNAIVEAVRSMADAHVLPHPDLYGMGDSARRIVAVLSEERGEG
jgi:UDP-GlcNAc3NAcA epimerase